MRMIENEKRSGFQQAYGLCICLFVTIMVLSLGRNLASGDSGVASDDAIRTSSIMLVDSAGEQRVVIAAELDSGLIKSEPFYKERRAPAGIAIFDEQGNRRAVFAVFADGATTVVFYDSEGERLHLFAYPEGQSGLLLQDPGGAFRLYQGVFGKETRLRYQSESGNPRIDIRVNDEEGARIELFDAEGAAILVDEDR